MLYYDAHTHWDYCDCSRVVAIRNCAISEIPGCGYYSVGVHPSDAKSVRAECLEEELLSKVSDPRVKAVGECGLDRRYLDFELQEDIFKIHCRVAQSSALPLIIHSVRSLSEVLRLSKGVGGCRVLHAQGRWDSNIERAGNVFLSLGYRNMARVQSIPLSRVLLESDDNMGVGIERVYEMFSKARGVALDELKQIIEENFKHVFLCK